MMLHPNAMDLRQVSLHGRNLKDQGSRCGKLDLTSEKPYSKVFIEAFDILRDLARLRQPLFAPFNVENDSPLTAVSMTWAQSI